MKVPSWSYVVGILMMLFGGCTVLKSAQGTQQKSFQEQIEGNNEMMERFNIENENAVDPDSLTAALDSMVVSLDSLKNSDLDNPFAKKMLDMVGQVINMSEYTKTWLVRFAYIGIFVGLLYLIGGLLLMVPKTFSVKIALAALILSIILGIAQPIILSLDPSGSAFSFITGLGGIFSIIVDIILLIVIMASDKSVYRGDYVKDPADDYI